jgi:hypothetical protein
MLERLRSFNLVEKMKLMIRKPIFLLGLGIVLITLLSGSGYGIWRMQQSPAQPIQFNHEVHVGFGVQSLETSLSRFTNQCKVLGMPPANPDQEC